MFNKVPERNGSPMISNRPGNRAELNSASVIGADLVIKGNLECKGEVQIDGRSKATSMRSASSSVYTRGALATWSQSR